jgi:pantoate--beta-alanine ligase
MSAEVAGTIARVRAWREDHRLAGRRVGFVPTMGALHEGHARLIETARRNGDQVIVSVFVNPLQFDRKDDLERYPRTFEADLRLCSALGVQLVFAPSVGEMYPAEPMCTVSVKRITERLCGQFRPGHFDGVATVVTKLFDIVQPDVAYFGEKDAQQLAVIRRMVRDLDMPVEIVGVSTVREPDGLALSSRNARLSADERSKSTALYRALRDAERAIAAGERDARAVERRAAAVIPPDASLRLEYLEVVDPVELQRVDTIAGTVLVAGALWVGSTRLIDNITCDPSRKAASEP